MNPPIRTRYDKEMLWSGMIQGVIDVIESDHAPHTLEEKNVDFATAPSGVPGVETMYPLLLGLVKKEQLSFNRLCFVLCERPAEIMGVSKGKLEVGRDADFIVVDFKHLDMIRSDRLHSKCGWTPFEDWPGIFPSSVFLRGEKLIEDGEMVGKQGFGEYIGGV